jgi:hypothetical protein
VGVRREKAALSSLKDHQALGLTVPETLRLAREDCVRNRPQTFARG